EQAGETQQEQQQAADAGQQELQETAAVESPLAAMPASDVIGADVVNAEGETVADIVDLVKRTGEDQLYAVLSVGGFLGIGDKKVVVPINDLDVTQDGQIVMANASEDELKNMPQYEEEGYETAQQQQ
ncbi:MAG TPA: PRC-barrel domain-containing protein, partial [Geminicoccaceae bacterium]|nr:PRC-barrel domain-containing protein [Geminicoccaceae bacterium]